MRKLSPGAVAGSALGLGAIVGGQWLEGGSVGQLVQGTAALIVVGGTMGATLLSYSWDEFRRAARSVPRVYQDETWDPQPVINEIVELATVARKEGVLAIEGHREKVRDPLFKRQIKYVIDGFEPLVVREIMEAEAEQAIEHEELVAKVFETAGGYAPTVGIIGAVLGLIHVMSMLNEPSRLGEGIAVAFVATVYGVALANLIFLPWGARIKRQAAQIGRQRELVMQGVIGIQEGLNPHFLKERLEVYAEKPAHGTARA